MLHISNSLRQKLLSDNVRKNIRLEFPEMSMKDINWDWNPIDMIYLHNSPSATYYWPASLLLYIAILEVIQRKTKKQLNQ